MVIAQLMTLSLVGYSFAVESGRLTVRQIWVGARWANRKPTSQAEGVPHSRRSPWQAPGLTNFSGQNTAVPGISAFILLSASNYIEENVPKRTKKPPRTCIRESLLDLND